ncbi:WD repeat-containing protein [Acrasis kona]|uniref:WD repeat-containing protein n=1 Tax=Acrasis kona TaxID=1008807 RepID=A0AAW2ZQU7_9EUKA
MQAYRVQSVKEEAHSDGVWSVAWSKGSLITGSVDASIKIWKGEALENSQTFDGHRLGVISVVTEKSGKYACSSSMDSMIRVWDLSKGTAVNTIEAAPAWTLDFSPDGRFIATGSQVNKCHRSANTGSVNVYGVESGKIEQSFDIQKKTFILTVAYSPNGRYLAAGGQDGSVAIFDVATSVKTSLEGHSMSVRSVAFTTDSERLLTASDDKHINVYDVKQGALIKTLSGHGSFVLSLDVSPTGLTFASSSTDRQIKIWELSTLECIHTFEEHKDQVWDIAYDETGAKLASVSDDHSIRVYTCPTDTSK